MEIKILNYKHYFHECMKKGKFKLFMLGLKRKKTKYVKNNKNNDKK